MPEYVRAAGSAGNWEGGLELFSLPGKKSEAEKGHVGFLKTWAQADTAIRSSCFCPPGR
jgi:hypothetical protein